MKAILEVEMDGPAFSRNGWETELHKSLTSALRRTSTSDRQPTPVFDSDGARVGELRIESTESDYTYQYSADDCPGRPCGSCCDHKGLPPTPLQPTPDVNAEMLEALKDVANATLYEYQGSHALYRIRRDWLESAKAAIARAESREPQPTANEPSPLPGLRAAAHDELVAAAQDVLSHLEHYVATHPLVTEAGLRVLRFRAALANVEALT